MAPPALTATVRYVPPGTRKIYFVVTVANYTTPGPTRAELNAGTDLTNEIASITGFTVTSDTIEVPDMSGRFAAKIAGRIHAADSAMMFYLSSTSADVRTVLPRDTVGYVVALWEGDITGQKMDVFPVKVTSATIQTDTEAAAQIEVAFAVTRVPALNLTIP